ncbi:MAG TPA: trypsin-like peptidase domain-containing protein [Burkholderiales bacterium]|nr:trypsin-like peptidase domain-containing protein [Burkholderiales bacterium]
MNARPVVESPVPSPEKPVEKPRLKWRDLYTRFERPTILAALIGLAAYVFAGASPAPQVQAKVEPPVAPAPAAVAYAAAQRAVVRVRAIGDGLEHDEYIQKALGTGVVIVADGTVLTNHHVVAGASRVRVLFAEGLESEATIVAARPENDLAVLKVQTLPDDLAVATMGSARDLVPGDPVFAIGFPFGIGPSVSAGVVSGLRREYRPEGGQSLSELIQFDAAVNPGSSGGPLLNSAGEVVGIVTAILDPSGRGAFAGIGFAVTIEAAAKAAGSPPF